MPCWRHSRTRRRPATRPRSQRSRLAGILSMLGGRTRPWRTSMPRATALRAGRARQSQPAPHLARAGADRAGARHHLRRARRLDRGRRHLREQCPGAAEICAPQIRRTPCLTVAPRPRRTAISLWRRAPRLTSPRAAASMRTSAALFAEALQAAPDNIRTIRKRRPRAC